MMMMMTKTYIGPHLPPPVLLGILLCVLHHVLNIVFAEASRRLDHDCTTAGDSTPTLGTSESHHFVNTTNRPQT